MGSSLPHHGTCTPEPSISAEGVYKSTLELAMGCGMLIFLWKHTAAVQLLDHMLCGD